MARNDSPYRVGDYWLDKRRNGKSPDVWQIARSERGTIIYCSTRKRTHELDAAKAVLDAHVDLQRARQRHDSTTAPVAPLLFTYWNEVGHTRINRDQTERSLRTFLAFLLQDEVGIHAVAADLTPMLFERFRKWRMGPHGFEDLPWGGKAYTYTSDGVAGSTVQRNINDVRAAIHHAEKNNRLTNPPRIGDLPSQYRSPARDRILDEEEMARIFWYAKHSPALFRFVALQMATSVRPIAALQFDPRTQYDDKRGIIDLQPTAAPQTKKRNAIIPAILPLRPILRAWAAEGAQPAASHRKAWQHMREVLGLSADVQPKTIRYTIATWLYEMEWIPERQISEMLGHIDDTGGLARTSRVYAQYRPERMGQVTKGLSLIWLRIRPPGTPLRF